MLPQIYSLINIISMKRNLLLIKSLKNYEEVLVSILSKSTKFEREKSAKLLGICSIMFFVETI